MSLKLPPKKGLSSATIGSIPEQWDAEWFRRFITTHLADADTRNTIGGEGITVTGAIGSPATLSVSSGGVGPDKLAPAPALTVLGNPTASTGPVEDVTMTQLTSLLNEFTSTEQGVVPASGGNSSTYLNGSGGWTTPSGSGTPTSQIVYILGQDGEPGEDGMMILVHS